MTATGDAFSREDSPPAASTRPTPSLQRQPAERAGHASPPSEGEGLAGRDGPYLVVADGQLTASTERAGEAVILTVTGVLDDHTTPWLTDTIQRLAQQHQPPLVLLDLNEVQALSPEAVEALGQLHQQLDGLGVLLRVVAAHRGPVRASDLSDAAPALAVFATRHGALNGAESA